MAECPKCHTHLKLTDWRQKCPYCGANIVLYDLQERMMQDADIAEVQYYHFSKKIDRLKTAFLGSKLTIVRIFTSIMPLAAIFLPMMVVKIKEPLIDYNGNFGALQIYNSIGSIDLKVIETLLANQQTKGAVIGLISFLLFVLLGLVILVIHLVCLMMACGKRARLRNYTLDTLFLLSAIAALVSITVIGKTDIIEAKIGYGSIVYLILVILNFVFDILVFKENLEVKHAPCYVGGIPIEEYFKMVEAGVSHEDMRKEMYKRLLEMQNEKNKEEKKDIAGGTDEIEKKEDQAYV